LVGSICVSVLSSSSCARCRTEARSCRRVRREILEVDGVDGGVVVHGGQKHSRLEREAEQQRGRLGKTDNKQTAGRKFSLTAAHRIAARYAGWFRASACDRSSRETPSFPPWSPPVPVSFWC
jgi:hypothetical protein